MPLVRNNIVFMFATSESSWPVDVESDSKLAEAKRVPAVHVAVSEDTLFVQLQRHLHICALQPRESTVL